MLKAIAVIRTLFLVFILGYTIRAMPWTMGLPSDSAQAYNLCRASLSLVSRAAWLAVAWIALETLVGWWIATRRKPVEPGIPKPGSSEPPVAPPPHR